MSVQCLNLPHNWEILQQTNGYATLSLHGTYELPKDAEAEHYKIYVGIYDESDGVPTIEPVLAMQNQGTWQATLTIPTGGLYRLEINDSARKHGTHLLVSHGQAVHHLGVGDNYVIAGQSNASGTARGEMEDAPDMMVHVFRDQAYWDLATDPLDFPRCFRAPWLAFAKTLSRRLGYPVGLIPTAVGGSLIASWLPEERGELYANMMRVLKDNQIGVKGVIWYQGCSEALMQQGGTYYQRLLSFISHIRLDLSSPDLPIHLIQINRRMDGADTPEVRQGWNQVREAQRRLALDLPHVSITTAFDARMSDGIHNGTITNPGIGQRLAHQVLYLNYGIGTNHNPPDIVSAEMTAPTRLLLTFKDCSNLITFAVGKRTPITVEDQAGQVEIERIDPYDEYLSVRLERELVGDAYVSGMAGEELPYFISDGRTQIPMLGFYRFKIQK